MQTSTHTLTGRRPAGARKPASRTSAGSRRTDARTGRFLARLTLLPALALLLGAYSLFAAAQAQAQTLNPPVRNVRLLPQDGALLLLWDNIPDPVNQIGEPTGQRARSHFNYHTLRVRWRVKDTNPGTTGDQPGNWLPPDKTKEASGGSGDTADGIDMTPGSLDRRLTLPDPGCGLCAQLVNGTAYEVEWIFYRTDEGGGGDTGWRAVGTATPQAGRQDPGTLGRAHDVRLTPGDRTIGISWNKVEGADRYDIEWKSPDSCHEGTTAPQRYYQGNARRITIDAADVTCNSNRCSYTLTGTEPRPKQVSERVPSERLQNGRLHEIRVEAQDSTGVRAHPRNAWSAWQQAAPNGACPAYAPDAGGKAQSYCYVPQGSATRVWYSTSNSVNSPSNRGYAKNDGAGASIPSDLYTRLVHGKPVTVKRCGGAGAPARTTPQVEIVSATPGREDRFDAPTPLPATVIVGLSPPQGAAVTVDYGTADGTATAGSDYTAVSGTLTFAAGETRKTVKIPILDDGVEDDGETFRFILSNASSGVSLSNEEANVAIRNDDGGEPENNGGNDNNGDTPAPTNNNNNGGGSSGSGNAGGGSAGGGGGGSAPAPSSRAALSDLVVTPRDEDGNPGKRLALSPAFAPSTTAYTLDVPYTTGTLDIMPGLTSGTAAVGTRGAGAFPAAQSYPVSLPPGETTVIEITVTAEDGSRTRAYTLRATRAAPNTDPSLPALVVRGNDDADVNLSPAFSPDNTDYEASLAYAVDAVTLTPATRDTGARVRIGGREVPGGQASAPVPLAVGSNEITLTVTAEDGLATRAYTLTLARAGADAEPPAADPRALPDLSRALADDTQHSIATRLATARAPAPGRTAPLSARLTQALAAVLPGQAAGAAAPAPAFDPVLAEARVDSGWAAPAAPVNWQALLDNAGAALALGAAPDAGESPTGLASLSLWSDGAYRRVGGHNDGLDWSGDLLGARIGLDMRLTPSLTGGAALGWQRAGWTGNAGGAGATRHTLSLLGLNPYAGWQRGRLSAWVSGGLGKGTLNSRQRGDERSADGYSANGYSADGYSEDGYHGDTHSEDVATHTLGGGLAGRLFDTDALSLGLKAEALATSLATETHATRTHRLRLALDATHVRRLSNDAVLTPALELGLRHDGGAGPGGLGLEAGGALRYAGGPLTLRGQARALVGRGGYREWGLSGTAEWRARTDGRGLMLRLAPGLGSAQSGIGQLWAQGLRDKTHGAPQQAARLDASLSYAWDAPGHRGRITPYLELRRQQAAAAYRLGARWDAPSGFSLRLAGERTGGDAGLPADHALLLEGSWRPGR